MSNDLTKVILDLQTRLAKLEAGARTSQLQHASITGTAITVYDEDGETPLQYIGRQGDGTVGTVAVNGPVPPAPNSPAVTPGQLSLTVSWDGTFVDADGDPVPRPTDVEGVQVHVSDTSAFEPSSATLRGVLSVAGDLVVQPLVIEPKYVVLVAVTSSKVTGDPSAEVTATPQDVVPGDGTITETKIEDGAITTPKLAANAVEADKIAANAVTAGKIDAGAVTAETIDATAIDGMTITGATIRTVSSDGGLFVYDDEPTLGNLIVSVASQAGTDHHGNEYPQGLNVNEGVISGSQITIEPGDEGVFVYSNATVTKTFGTPGATSWQAPAGVTSVKVECWGGGGSGGSSGVPAGDGGGGGGGGEYAAEPSVAVTPGNNYTVTVGAGSTTASPGGTSSFVGDAVTVTAHGGSSTNNRNGAAGGTGSTNTIHFNGGAGGNGSSTDTAGGGGGSSASPAGPGENGEPGVGDEGGSGGFAGPGSGWGGEGGWPGEPGMDGEAPGGGGGGTGQNTGGLAGDGAHGLVRITYGSTDQVLAASIAGTAGTDAHGNDYPAGIAVFGTGGNAGVFTLQPPDATGFTWDPARVYGDVDPQGSGSDFPALVIESPTENSGVTEPRSSIFMAGPSTDLDDNIVIIDTNVLDVFSSGSAEETYMTFSGFMDVLGDVYVEGDVTARTLVAENIAGGSVFITPVANTPTSTTITGLGLPSGFSYVPQVTGNSASTAFQWVTASAPSRNGLTITLLRSNTTDTLVYWTLIGV